MSFSVLEVVAIWTAVTLVHELGHYFTAMFFMKGLKGISMKFMAFCPCVEWSSVGNRKISDALIFHLAGIVAGGYVVTQFYSTAIPNMAYLLISSADIGSIFELLAALQTYGNVTVLEASRKAIAQMEEKAV